MRNADIQLLVIEFASQDILDAPKQIDGDHRIWRISYKSEIF